MISSSGTAGCASIRQFFHINEDNDGNEDGKRAGPKGAGRAAVWAVTLMVILYTAYLIVMIVSHTIADADIPNEYREAANVLMTRQFSIPSNPYSLDALTEDPPCMIYLYGPLYSIAAAPLAMLFPEALTQVHYLLTLIFIISSAGMAAIMVRERTGTPFAPACAFLFLINCHWRYGYVNAVPDSMGLWMMVLILFLLTRGGLKHKGIYTGVLSVLIFFTKQYYLLIAATAAAWLFLFESRREFVKFMVSCAVTAAVLAAFIQWRCPLFWTYTLYLAKGPGKGVSSTVTRGEVKMSSMQYNLQQIMSIGGTFLMLFIAEAAGVITCFFRKKLAKTDVLMLGHMLIAGICLLYLGQNDGAWLSYYLQLFVPALAIGSCIMLDRFIMAVNGRGLSAASGQLSDRAGAFSAFPAGLATGLICLACLAFAGFTVMRTDARLVKSPMTEEDYRIWDEAERLLDENMGDMYLYPPLAYYGIRNNIYIYNTGQSFVVSERFQERYQANEEAREKFPYAGRIFETHLDYREEVLRRVREGLYSAVTYIPDYRADEIFTGEDLKGRYRRAGTYPLRTGRSVWNVEIWVRK